MLKTGIVLLSTLVVMAMFTTLLLYWYQNEIQYRLQAKASLRHQGIYQALDGLVSEIASLLTNYSEEQLRQNQIDILGESALGQPSTFFSGWDASSLPAGESDFIKIESSYQPSSKGVPSGSLNFEVLFHFHSYSLTDFPWINLSQGAYELPKNLIFNSEQDYQLALTVPKISLLPPSLKENFETVIYGDAQIEWQVDQITIMQGSKKIVLNSGSDVQIKGDVTILGDLSYSDGKRRYFDIQGNLDLMLPNKPKAFPNGKTTLIIHVTKQLSIFSEQSNNSSLQINGFIWTEGSSTEGSTVENSCFSSGPYVQAIYWKGGIACHLDGSLTSVPIHLLHSSGRHSAFSNPPSGFNRTALIWNGIRPLE